MPVHVLKEGLRVFDRFIGSISDAGKGQGAPGANPPHAFPGASRGRHVVNFLIKKGFSRPVGCVRVDFVVLATTCMLIDVLGEFTLLGPPMGGV